MTVLALRDPLREVRLYGALGREFGRLHLLAVRSPAEAVQALCAVLPGFERAFLGPLGRLAHRYHVFVGRGAQRETIALEEADEALGVLEPIRFVPVIEGAKNSGFLQIIIGAAILFAAPYAAGALFGAGASVGLSVGVSVYGTQLGAALALGGLLQLISPQRSVSTAQATNNQPSYGFDGGPVNTTQEGLPVPLAFGRVVIGSAQVSGGLSTDDIAITASSSTTIPPATLPTYQPQDPYNGGDGDRGSAGLGS